MSGEAKPSACDVLIVGAGPAGIAAALAAAPSGARIVLIDDNPQPGGQIWRGGPDAVRLPRPPRAQRMLDALAGCANVSVHSGTRVVARGGAPGECALLLEDAERGWTQHYERLILCTGARELLLPFAGWTLPGVTGAGGLQALIKGGVDVAGQRVVIAGSGPLLLAAAASARAAGAHVLRIAEQAGLGALAAFTVGLTRWPGKLAQAVMLAHPAWRAARHVVEATGDGRVQRVRLRRANGGEGGEGDACEETIECDRLACGFGLIANTQLAQMLGCALDVSCTHGAIAVDARQATSVAGVFAAGECTGFGGVERALVQGECAAYAALGDERALIARRPALKRWDAFAAHLRRHFALGDEIRRLARPQTLVCRCEDVAYAELAPRRGWIDAKLHTRCGMGACQGRVCGAAAPTLFGWNEAPVAPHHLLAPARLATLAAADDGNTSALD
jgi:NADPH-dependent 2,4-dienoyl-CoA reductase/sulfur reductase-like enzyme